tara:strand:- start:313 stop:756 length:444 start_codon:yes stop_codon:yes gene_type:complete
MRPQLSTYSREKNIHKDVKVEYDFDVMSKSRNTIYDLREDRKNLQLLSVKITNQSKDNLVFTEENLDIKTLLGVPLITARKEEFYINQIKQQAAWYMIYSFSGLTLSWASNDDRNRLTVIPIGLLVGLYNLALGIDANARFKKSMKK